MYKHTLIFILLQCAASKYGLCHAESFVGKVEAAEAASEQAEQQVPDHHGWFAGSPTHAHAKLRLAETKLLSSNSSLLDVQGGINLLLDIADVLQQHMAGAAPQLVQHQQESPRAPDGDHSTANHQQQQKQQRRTDGGSSSRTLGKSRDAGIPLQRLSVRSARGADRAKQRRSRHSRASAVWTPLGRAGFMLAGLSASGLFTEFLPPPPPAVPASNSNDAAAAAAQQELAWLQTAALAGHADAQLALADRYRFGRGGVAANCNRGLAWLKQAAKSLAAKAEQELDIDLPAPVVLLRDRWYDANYPSGVVDEKLLSRALEADAAIHGDSYSLRRLGYRRLVGRGVPVDPAEAFHDFVAAADGGDGYALYNLGYMCLQGIHMPRSPAKAISYFRRALERGVAASANAIGVMHFHGWGVPPDVQLAMGWFEQGANMSNPESFFNLGTMYAQGVGVSRDPSQALKYYSKAHSLGHWKAAYTMAHLYMKGKASGGLGYDCHTATQHLWQFIAGRSAWTEGSNAALRLYDTPERAASIAVAQPYSPDGTEAAAADNAAAAAAAQKVGDSASAAAAAAAAAAATTAADEAEAKRAGAVAAMPSTSSTSGAVVTVPQLGPAWWPRWTGRFTQSLLQYLLLAESGCGDCGVNAAWMLMRGEGAGGPRALAAAADYLYRSSLLNHTSSMILLSQLLIEAASSTQATSADPSSSAAAAAAAATPLHSVPLLQRRFLQNPGAFLPLIGGPTLATGKLKTSLPSILQQVRNCDQDPQSESHTRFPAAAATAATLYGNIKVEAEREVPQAAEYMASSSNSAGGSSGGSGSSATSGSSSSGRDAPDASLLMCRVHRAAIAWLHESAQAGDSEAAANLAWLWQRGELLPADADRAAKLMDRAVQHSEYTIGYPALVAMQVAMKLERAAQQLLGNNTAAAVVRMVSSMHSSAARLFGYSLDVVLALPDGLHVPVTTSQYYMQDAIDEILQWQFNEVSRVGLENMSGGSGPVWAAHSSGDTETDRDVHLQETRREHSSRSSTGGGSSSSRQTSGKKRGGDAAGAADGQPSGMPVDVENLILTVLLGILAGVLWLRRRIYQ